LSCEEKNFIYKGNKKVKGMQIVDEGILENSLGALHIQDLDLEKYDYFIRKDEKGNWKLDSIVDKKRIDEKITFNETEKNLGKKGKRCIYLWDTIDIIEEEGIWKEVLRKLKIAKIEKVYLQIPYKLYEEEENFWIRKRGKSLYKFLKDLMDNNFEMEILDGYKGFSLEPLHFRVINQINYFKYFWEKYFPSKPLPPFHLDIEPYTLRFYNNKNYKEIYGQYLNLLKKIRRSFPDLEFYLDIPFWLDNLKGGKEILEGILDNSDGFSVMAYRSKIEGDSGILDVSKNELNLASDKNKKIYLALETQNLPPDKVYKVYENENNNFHLFLRETNRKGLFFISLEPGKWGVDVFEETPPERISLFNRSWEDINNFIEELLKFNNFDGIAIHHWGSIKKKIK
ncbi:MAG: hypothetical protein WHV67_04155, partial [Thermoanaerobaculia bacterium]